MGKPGANITTITLHGGIVTVGAPTVLLENKPASRIGDMHTCPLFDGPKPHVGGPILLGSFTVWTCSVPQSYQGMPAICVGPPDKLEIGAVTVQIGMNMGFGGFALILGGLIAGLVNFVSGYPKAVMQPDGTIVTQYNEFITITGDAEFQAKVVRDLNKISGTPSGQKLLASMASSGKNCRIQPEDPADPGNAAWTDPGPPTNNNHRQQADGTAGSGSDTQIWYNPDRTSLSGPPGSPYNTADWAQEGNRPADVGLFHEMVHADDMMTGTMPNGDGTNHGPKAGQPISNDELRAAGLPPYENEEYSENTYRDDLGLPNRDFY
ncbi:MAG: PAAR domain-containing protein [Bryobacterales bacterium]|nr:PAAR domain-containing protein [Bryobacterales bacterium]